MKIEVKNREPYIKKCEENIKKVLDARAERDATYIQKWRRELWGLFGRENRMPPHHWPYYPSMHGWGTLAVCTTVLEALKNPDIGMILLDSKDLHYLD